MSDMDRREFLSKATQAAGSVLVGALLMENLHAEVPGKTIAADVPVDDDLWIGGY